MRLTCRPPERTKPRQPDFHHPSMTAIPTSPPPLVPSPPPPPAPPLPTTPPRSLPPPTPQFFSAPLVLSRDPKPYRASPVVGPRPSQNDILKRIVKADDGIKKKSTQHNAHFKTVNKGSKRGNVVPPPPLSKYKRPPPIVPHRPGDRYPLGIPYTPLLTCLADGGRRRCAREDCAQNSKASVSRHCISEYVQKGARGSCIPKDLRVEWCNTCYMTLFPLFRTPANCSHRRDADYYPR